MNEKTDITGQIEGCKFPQWYLEQGNEKGKWTSEEVAVVEAVLRPEMQAFTDRFGDYADNYWRIWKMGWSNQQSFTAIKCTWEHGALGGTTAEEIAEKIRAYYSKPYR